MSIDKRVIAINLPQFHPFKENNDWWGEGFTEWTNVTKASPRFEGHYQPHLPTDTGFYDLRLPDARQMQADMARAAGIYGFCYYHYWFNGHRLMERPVNEILASGEPDFPFMLCWANENWARNWDGGYQNILMEQKYCIEDDIAHMEYLCKEVFSDKRYIRVDGKPFFVLYRPELVDNIEETIFHWRETAKKFGEELYLGFFKRYDLDCKKYLATGFDVVIDFQPFSNISQIPTIDNRDLTIWKRILRKFGLQKWPSNYIYDYEDVVNYACKYFDHPYKFYHGITPQWDNSPRRVGKPFLAFINSTPELYGKWLRYILSQFTPYSKEENFVFINAWNEWAEGNHLEPDNKHGRAYLEETRAAIGI